MYKSYVHAGRAKHGVFYDKKDISVENEVEIGNASLATFGFVERLVAGIMGDVLTIIDASIQDSKQNKAIKDLIKKSLGERLEFCADWLQDQDAIDKQIQETMTDEELEEVEPVDIDVALGVNED